MTHSDDQQTTDFGFTQVPLHEKAEKVASVFHAVSSKYDLMNDFLSFGLHRFWKRFAVELAGFRPNQTVLDLAGGTGDLTARIHPLIKPHGKLVLCDINESMLNVGRDRLIDAGFVKNIDYVLGDAQTLPFPTNYFDRIVMGFGLRNVTDKSAALASMYQTLKPGGCCLILEFTTVDSAVLRPLYDAYSFQCLPKIGKWIADDEAAYRYLAESIRMHPDKKTLKALMENAGFERCDFHTLTGGIVAIHRGFKL